MDINLLVPDLLQNLSIREYHKNDIVFSEGDLSDQTMFFIVKGEFDVFQERAGKEELLEVIKDGQFFGEIGLIGNRTRSATVKVTSDRARLILLNKDSFFLLATKSPPFLFAIFRGAVKKLVRANQQYYTLVKDLEETVGERLDSSDAHQHSNIMDYVNGIVTKAYVKGDYVFVEGDLSNGTMYFICHGELQVKKRMDNRDRILAKLKEGDFFGEIAIIQNAPRSATVQAYTHQVSLAPINKELFVKICKYNPGFLYSLLKTMFFRLLAMEEKIEKIIQKIQ